MTYNVLVAEPDNHIWASLANGVRRYQPEAAIVRVKDGEQAVRHLFQRGLLTDEPETPHVLVVATQLPIVSTEQVIDRLRQHPRTQSIPVIVIRPDDEPYLCQPGVVEVSASARLEKELANVLTRLHGTEAPKAANAPCIPQ